MGDGRPQQQRSSNGDNTHDAFPVRKLRLSTVQDVPSIRQRDGIEIFGVRRTAVPIPGTNRKERPSAVSVTLPVL